MESAGPAAATAFAFSLDGRLLAAGCKDNTLRVWETATGKELRRFQGPHGGATDLAFSPDTQALASVNHNGTALVWDVFGRTVDGQCDLDQLWKDLAGDDAVQAQRAVRRLAAIAPQAVPFLQERLKPIAPVDQRRLALLLADLESKDFSARQKAADELEKLGELAAPALRKVLGGKPALDLCQRVQRLLTTADDPAGTAARLRTLRALQTLEYAATPEARLLLEQLAKGTPEARLTQAAKAALERLSKRLAAPRVPRHPR